MKPIPKKIDGWNVFRRDDRYWMLFRRIDGKTRTIHLGTAFSSRAAKEKIKAFLRNEGRTWLRKSFPVYRAKGSNARHCFFNVSPESRLFTVSVSPPPVPPEWGEDYGILSFITRVRFRSKPVIRQPVVHHQG